MARLVPGAATSRLQSVRENGPRVLRSRMNLKDIFRRFVPMRWQRTTRGEPLSMVLLLRKPHLFSAEELQHAAERAWRMSFAGREDNSKHCVVQSATVTFMKAGPHALSVFHNPKPYFGDDPKENVNWLPHLSQQQAWINHSAWAAVNYLNGGVRVELGYAVLSKLVAEMLDGNCTGVYSPRQGSLIPNDESLYLELHKLASACESGVNMKT